MAIVRFDTDNVLTTDSSEYEILADATQRIKDVPGAIVEIGSRRGGSAKIIIDGLAHAKDTDRTMICIDPYGNIEYLCTDLNIAVHFKGEGLDSTASKENTQPIRLDYTNQMRNDVVPTLYYYAYQKGLNFHFMQLEDTEFFKRYGDGFPVYDQFKKLENQYALVFFDGPHWNDALIEEIQFFASRAPVGSVFVFDDIWMYDHDKIEKFLETYDFKLLHKGGIKASYVREEISLTQSE